MANQTVDIAVEMFSSTWRSLGRTARDESILDTEGLRSPIFTTDCFSRKEWRRSGMCVAKLLGEVCAFG